MKEFFGEGGEKDRERRALVENLRRRLGFASAAEMRKMAEEVTEDWRVRRHTPRDWEDAAAHLVAAVGKKQAAARAARVPTRESPPAPGLSESAWMRDIEEQSRRRESEFREQKRRSVRPADLIRRYGYDPDRVTLAQVMNPDWRRANPPECGGGCQAVSDG